MTVCASWRHFMHLSLHDFCFRTRKGVGDLTLIKLNSSVWYDKDIQGHVVQRLCVICSRLSSYVSTHRVGQVALCTDTNMDQEDIQGDYSQVLTEDHFREIGTGLRTGTRHTHRYNYERDRGMYPLTNMKGFGKWHFTTRVTPKLV